jgi:hypothetical protein
MAMFAVTHNALFCDHLTWQLVLTLNIGHLQTIVQEHEEWPDDDPYSGTKVFAK